MRPSTASLRPVEDLPVRSRPAPREHIFSALSYAKSPSTNTPELALPSRRAVGSANPTAMADRLLDGPAPQRVGGNVPGSLYMFDPTEASAGFGSPPAEVAPRTIARRYHNEESTTSREWQPTGIRHVAPPQKVERQGGLRIVSESRNYHSQAAVVGSPLMESTRQSSTGVQAQTPRAGIRCAFNESPQAAGSTMRKVLDRYGALDGTSETEVVVGSNAKKRLANHTVNRVEKFTMAVADHIEGRSGGASTFFVALCRGLVAGNGSAPAVSADARDEASRNAAVLWLQQAKRPLLLEDCRRQLAALTGVDISRQELAGLLWDMSGHDGLDDQVLAELEVSYQVFAAAFMKTQTSARLTSFKI